MKKFTVFILLISMILCCFGCSKKKEETIPPQEQTEPNQTEEQLESNQTEEQPESIHSEEEKKQAFLENKIQSMTTEQKIGQLIMTAFRKDAQDRPVLTMDEEIKKEVAKYQFGGMILFGENIDTEEQTKTLIRDYQSLSEIPLFIGIDEEGGRVSRLHNSGKINMVKVPAAEKIGNTKDPKQAYEWYSKIGEKLLELGFHVDFAPVADVNTNPENTVIGDRAFGSDPEKVGEMVFQSVKGLQDQGISAALKHFPGHGDTSTDTHTSETFLNQSLTELEAAEWIPFQKGMEAEADFVMIAHIKTPNATSDGLPASLSKEMIQSNLRDKLGFKGIVITDAMDMGAISIYYDSAEASIKAINAGVDILLMPQDIEKVFSALNKAVETGEISEERLNEAVKRILSLKYEKGMFTGQGQ